MDAKTCTARAIACVSLLLVAVPAARAAPQAHPAAASPERADPADATAAVPAAPYRSALSAYRPFTDTATAPWRDTNDRVRQRGGWRAYAREAAASDAGQAPPPASTPPPSPRTAPRTAPGTAPSSAASSASTATSCSCSMPTTSTPAPTRRRS